MVEIDRVILFIWFNIFIEKDLKVVYVCLIFWVEGVNVVWVKILMYLKSYVVVVVLVYGLVFFEYVLLV